MIIIVIIGGAISGSKASGFGIWYWGYTAWKMYKRDNASLVSLQKIMLWFQGIGSAIAFGVLFFSNSDSKKYIDITPWELLIIASLAMGLTFFLYSFFQKQISNTDNSTMCGNSSSEPVSQQQIENAVSAAPQINNQTQLFNQINFNNDDDDHFWEQAANEIDNNQKKSGLWAKCFAESNGDEAKAKAAYLKTRFLQLKDIAESDRLKAAAEIQAKKERELNELREAERIARLGLPALCPKCKGEIRTTTEACFHCNSWLGKGSDLKPISVNQK